MFDVLFEEDTLWFSIPALLGSGIFILRIAMMLIGGDGGDGFEADAGDIEFDGSDSTGAFEILSIQGISAFMVGFGWVGIGSMLGAGWSTTTSFTLGFLGGLAMVWILGNTLSAARSLESSGNISIERPLGKTGEVYARIPARGDGKGQVRLIVSSHQRIYNAISEGPEFPTSSRIRVIGINDDNTLTVGPD